MRSACACAFEASMTRETSPAASSVAHACKAKESIGGRSISDQPWTISVEIGRVVRLLDQWLGNHRSLLPANAVPPELHRMTQNERARADSSVRSDYISDEKLRM